MKRRTLLRGIFAIGVAFAVAPELPKDVKAKTWEWVELPNGLEMFVTGPTDSVSVAWSDTDVSVHGMRVSAGDLTMRRGYSLTVRRRTDVSRCGIAGVLQRRG